MNEETFEGKGDIRIFTRSWQPEGKAKAVIVIAHGFNSHSGQYMWVGDQFTKNGFAVYALDHRGRGKSGGERFYVESFSDYVNDLAAFVKHVKTREPGLPVFLLGHSAGGVISCLYTLDNQSELAGLICESFAYQVPAPDFAIAVLKGLAHVTPHAHVLTLKNEDFSRDPKAVQSMNDDPLIAGESQPVQTVAELARADDRLKRSFSQITLPVLILHGTGDKATKPSGSQYFYDNAGATDKTLKLYEGHFHDLLNDIGKDEVMGTITNWINARVPAPQ
jgi:acylglycerol lipase